MIEIKSYLGAVLHRSELDTVRRAVEEAVAKGAYLRGADLLGADLRGAYLRGAYLGGAYLGGAYLGGADLGGADLRGADLGGAKLIGDRPVFAVGPIGSRSSYLTSYLTDEGIKIAEGCWRGSLTEFVERVAMEHKLNKHGREYLAAVAMIQAHAEIWLPKAENADAANCEATWKEAS